jgi:hypothetical protein
MHIKWCLQWITRFGCKCRGCNIPAMVSWGWILHVALRKEQAQTVRWPSPPFLRITIQPITSFLRRLYYTKFMMWIALTCKIHIAWGMNSFIQPHPFINFCILLWREKVFPIHLMFSLIWREIIYRAQHILVPKRQVLFLILTRRWKRTESIFRDHKSVINFRKKILLHQWSIGKISVLISIK